MLEKILAKMPFKRTLVAYGFLLKLNGCGDTIINDVPVDIAAEIEPYSLDVEGDICEKIILYGDDDKDWFGNKDKHISVCLGEQREGYTSEVGDCDDNDPEIHPGKKEECDGKDNDCNKLIDDSLIEACYSPCVDGEGYKECVNGEWKKCSLPQPEEETFDGKDNDCDGLIDNNVILWQFPIKYCEINGSLSVAPNGDVLVLGGNGLLYALNPTGPDEERELWEAEIGEVGESGDVILPNPVISDQGNIFVGGKSIMTFNDLGELLWQPHNVQICVSDSLSNPDLSGKISLSLSSGGTTYVGVKFKDIDIWVDDTCGYLEAITSAGQLWHNKTNYSQTGVSIGEDGLIYSGSGKFLNIRNPITGSLEWNVELPMFLPSGYKITNYAPVFSSNEAIYLVSENKLVAVDLKSKNVLWDFFAGEDISSPVVDSVGDVYFGSEDGIFYSLYSDGTDKWANSSLGTSRSPTLTSNGLIYVSRPNGLFVANTEDGTLEHKLTEDKLNETLNPSIVTLGEQGDIYFCNLENNRIYAVKGKYLLDADASWPTWQHDSQHTGDFNHGKE